MMKAFPDRLFAIASLAPFAFALTSALATEARSAEADSVVKIIGGKEVARTRCEWYNFFQSLNMWPKYKLCPGKNVPDSYGFYLSDVAASSTLAIFLKLNREQNAVVSGDFVSGVTSRAVSLRIGATSHTASVCEWHNLFQSRYRTPYYLECDGKTNRQSFGRYAEADFQVRLNPNINEQTSRPAPNTKGFLKSASASRPLTLKLGEKDYTRSVCEWHNFFQSFNPLPRFVACSGKTPVESFAQYLFGQNIVALNVSITAEGNATSVRFGEDVSVQLGKDTISVKRCALYNWLQSNIRWPIYRGCGATTQISFANADPRVFPKADRRSLYNQNYTD
jgi:hypothetical protein